MWCAARWLRLVMLYCIFASCWERRSEKLSAQRTRTVAACGAGRRRDWCGAPFTADTNIKSTGTPDITPHGPWQSHLNLKKNWGWEHQDKKEIQIIKTLFCCNLCKYVLNLKKRNIFRNNHNKAGCNVYFYLCCIKSQYFINPYNLATPQDCWWQMSKNTSRLPSTQLWFTFDVRAVGQKPSLTEQV